MDYVSNQEVQQTEMLRTIGVEEVSSLFRAIPDKLKLSKPLSDDGISEFEGIRMMEKLSSRNTYLDYDSYLGAGAYEHHVPALVGAICAKSEFLTSYTPYQPEASQGMLQTIFEYQSAICALTGMEVSNASVYDGASACAEAVLMALRARKGRSKVLIAKALHPQYKGAVLQYLGSQDVEIVELPFNEEGRVDVGDLLDENTAAILLQSPNFLGIIEDAREVFSMSKAAGAVNILSANPLSYGIFKTAGELGADIAVGDLQPFGIPLQFGGPYAGYIACRQELVRQLPGRLVGETVDTNGRRGYVLTLQAREQHIRREKATSNICTNQALAALASLVAISWYGKQGVKELALTNYRRASYLKDRLSVLPGVKTFSEAPTFNEFTVRFDEPIVKAMKENGIIPGFDLGRVYPDLHNHLLVAVTETKSLQQLDRYVDVAGRGGR